MNIKNYYQFLLYLTIIIIFLSCNTPGSNDSILNNFFDTSPVEIENYSPNTKYVNNEDVTVYIKFSKEMNTESVEAAFTFDEDGKRILGNFKWSGADKEFTFSPDKQCEYGKNYRVSITKSAEDINGNDLKNPFTHYFIIGNDEGCPYVILEQCQPTPNSTLHSTDPNELSLPVIVVFSEPMFKEYPYKYVKLTCRGVEIKGIYEWLDANGIPVDQFSGTPCSRLRFIPNSEYEINEIYKVEISNEITDVNNNPLRDNYIYQFIIDANFERPEIGPVTAFINENNTVNERPLDSNNLTQGLTKDAYFRIIFTRSMHREDTEKSVVLSDNNIKVRYKWETTNPIFPDDTLFIILENNNYFEYNEIYSLNIYKDAHDTSNNKLENDHSYRFIVNHPNSISPVLQKIYLEDVQKYDTTTGNWGPDPDFELWPNGTQNSIPYAGVELLEASEQDGYITFAYTDEVHDTEREMYFYLYFNSYVQIYENSLTDPKNFILDTIAGDVSLTLSSCAGSVPATQLDPHDAADTTQYYVYVVKIIPGSNKDVENTATVKFYIKGGNDGVHDLNGNFLEESIEFLILFDFSGINP